MPEALPTTLKECKVVLQERLRGELAGHGILTDVQETVLSAVTDQAALAPFAPFAYKLYTSAAATRAIHGLLRCTLPGTIASYKDALDAIAAKGHHCFLIGGQVRDILRGVLSTDIDFNYSCSAREVALITIDRSWPTKYKLIGGNGAAGEAPNYVLIGDEGSNEYLEGAVPRSFIHAPSALLATTHLRPLLVARPLPLSLSLLCQASH